MSRPMKACSKCSRIFPLDTYAYRGWRNGQHRRSSQCKECVSLYSKAYVRNDHARRNETTKKRYQRDPSPFYRANMKYRYRITDDELAFILSEACCEICGRDGEERKLSVDHCHDKGHIRGLLCHHCNAGLGFFGDDVISLHNAIQYLMEKS